MMHGKSYDKMSAEDKMYQADEDCRTMVEYGEIMMDKTRYKAAKVRAKEKMEALKYAAMDMGKMGKMSYPEYSKGRKAGMGNGKDHYA